MCACRQNDLQYFKRWFKRHVDETQFVLGKPAVLQVRCQCSPDSKQLTLDHFKVYAMVKEGSTLLPHFGNYAHTLASGPADIDAPARDMCSPEVSGVGVSCWRLVPKSTVPSAPYEPQA